MVRSRPKPGYLTPFQWAFIAFHTRCDEEEARTERLAEQNRLLSIQFLLAVNPERARTVLLGEQIPEQAEDEFFVPADQAPPPTPPELLAQFGLVPVGESANA